MAILVTAHHDAASVASLHAALNWAHADTTIVFTSPGTPPAYANEMSLLPMRWRMSLWTTLPRTAPPPPQPRRPTTRPPVTTAPRRPLPYYPDSNPKGDLPGVVFILRFNNTQLYWDVVHGADAPFGMVQHIIESIVLHLRDTGTLRIQQLAALVGVPLDIVHSIYGNNKDAIIERVHKLYDTAIFLLMQQWEDCLEWIFLRGRVQCRNVRDVPILPMTAFEWAEWKSAHGDPDADPFIPLQHGALRLELLCMQNVIASFV
ncbi:hypothetical protein CALVIDRAFT_569592 [Calocera viscosa TUFC12733]|uniref:Uncharacterized protein n=1 Tax=Calocera viscosa (strain TUFC12733) TaxID=1330018 RepID=A0A167FTE9_CALVF|nr:hypothetical protein CALVIDRAFT_569592 [Calocera viscosa TUFC12733]